MFHLLNAAVAALRAASFLARPQMDALHPDALRLVMYDLPGAAHGGGGARGGGWGGGPQRGRMGDTGRDRRAARWLGQPRAPGGKGAGGEGAGAGGPRRPAFAGPALSRRTAPAFPPTPQLAPPTQPPASHPGLLFFTTYALLVLFWAEIYHQARSLPTGALRPAFLAANALVYAAQVLPVRGAGRGAPAACGRARGA